MDRGSARRRARSAERARPRQRPLRLAQVVTSAAEPPARAEGCRQREEAERAAHTRAAHTPLGAAPGTRPAEGRSRPAEGRSRPAAQAALPRSQAAARPQRSPARPWHRTDSCPQESRNARERARRHPGRVGPATRQGAVLRAGCMPALAERAAAKVAQAAGRTAGQRRAGHPTPELQAEPPAREAGRRMRAAALPRRAGCRKTGKTCWWADSKRHTACTRSCVNSRARAMPRTLARPSASSIPALPHSTQLKACGSVPKQAGAPR
jgi:hypothetical protein